MFVINIDCFNRSRFLQVESSDRSSTFYHYCYYYMDRYLPILSDTSIGTAIMTTKRHSHRHLSYY